jgi:hypothetical protein
MNTDRPLNQPEQICDEENKKDQSVSIKHDAGGPELIAVPSNAHGISKTNMTINLENLNEPKRTKSGIQIEDGAERVKVESFDKDVSRIDGFELE